MDAPQIEEAPKEPLLNTVIKLKNAISDHTPNNSIFIRNSNNISSLEYTVYSKEEQFPTHIIQPAHDGSVFWSGPKEIVNIIQKLNHSGYQVQFLKRNAPNETDFKLVISKK